MTILSLNDALKYSVVGTACWVPGDISATGAPILKRDDKYYSGYFGLSKTSDFKPKPNPYEAQKKDFILLLKKPAKISIPGTIESLCILEPLEKELIQLGINDPFKLKSLIAKEYIKNDNRTIIVQFGEMNEIAEKLLQYSSILQKKSLEKLKKWESISLSGLQNESFNTLLDVSFTFHTYAHPLSTEGKKLKNNLETNSEILNLVYAKITNDENQIIVYKTLFEDVKSLGSYRSISSFEELEKLANEKLTQLNIK